MNKLIILFLIISIILIKIMLDIGSSVKNKEIFYDVTSTNAATNPASTTVINTRPVVTYPNIKYDDLLKQWQPNAWQPGMPTNFPTLASISSRELSAENIDWNAIYQKLNLPLTENPPTQDNIDNDRVYVNQTELDRIRMERQRLEEQGSKTDENTATSNVGVAAFNYQQTIGSSPYDIGRSMSQVSGDPAFDLGYAGYDISSSYNLLPTNTYNNLDDYRVNNWDSNSKSDSSSSAKPKDILDSFPKTIIQKDFQGVSNIFAPNFIFLGSKEDYDVSFGNLGNL